MDLLKLDEVKKHKIDILIIIALFLLGFGVRMIPSESFPGIYGFDSFYHARMVRTLLQTGYIPDKDPLSYWPEHGKYKEMYPPFYHYTLAGCYSWIKLLTSGHTGYDENLFVPVDSSTPAFYGGLAVVAMYLLGLVIRNRKAGLFASLLFLGQSSFLFRTMYGFSEEDPMGIFLYTLSFAAFAWAIKNGKPKHGWIAGLVFGVFLITWRMAILPAAIIATFVLIEMLLNIWRKDYTGLERKIEVLIPSLIPLAILDFSYDTATNYGLISLVFLGSVAGIGILANYWFNHRKNKSPVKIFWINKSDLYKYASIAMVLLGIGLLVVKGQFIYQYTYNLVFKAPTQYAKLSYTIGEEHPATFAGVVRDMGLLTPLFLIGLIWLPIRRWKHRKEHTVELLVWLLAIATFYLYIHKMKMGYVFGTPLSIVVGVVLADVFALADWMKKKSENLDTRWLKAASMCVALILGFMVLSRAVVTMEQYKTSYSPQTGWIKAYDYLTSLPGHENYVLMTWWDYGHWSAWWGLKTTLDNTNQNSSKVIETARIFTDFRGKTTDEILKKHESELKKWQVTHIGVDRIVITCQKWGALTFLGDNVCIPKDELEKWGINYPEVLEGPTQGCPPGTVYAACMQGVYCKQGYDQNGNPRIVCPLGKANLVFTPEEWSRMINTKWPGYDLEMDVGGTILKAKVYARPDGYLMFFVDRHGRILPDAPANYMLGYRLFFQDPSITTLDLVGDFYGNLDDPKYRYVPEEEVVFWKVDYNKLEQLNITS